MTTTGAFSTSEPATAFRRLKAEGAYTIGHSHGADTPQSRISVCRIAGTDFIWNSGNHNRGARIFEDSIQKRCRVVAGDDEQALQAEFLKTLLEICCNGRLTHCTSPPLTLPGLSSLVRGSLSPLGPRTQSLLQSMRALTKCVRRQNEPVLQLQEYVDEAS